MSGSDDGRPRVHLLAGLNGAGPELSGADADAVRHLASIFEERADSETIELHIVE